MQLFWGMGLIFKVHFLESSHWVRVWGFFLIHFMTIISMTVILNPRGPLQTPGGFKHMYQGQCHSPPVSWVSDLLPLRRDPDDVIFEAAGERGRGRAHVTAGHSAVFHLT